MTSLLQRGALALVCVCALGCSLLPGGHTFDVVVLGGAGGLEEDNLTAFLLAPKGGRDFVALDAGTLRAGIARAMERGTLPRVDDGKRPAEEAFLRDHVKAYLVSHAHLDHVSGLIINSVEDTQKPVFGTMGTLGMLRDHAFNWKLWPNLTDTGTAPLGRYQFTPVADGPKAIPGTPFTVEAYALSHGAPYRSSAFLVRHGKDAVLYLGDTGPDAVENSTLLTELWLTVAPVVRAGGLKAIFLECSYPDGRADKELFGHLTPKWFMEELERLGRIVNAEEPDGVLRGITVVVTHIKPGVVDGKDTRLIIQKQLERANKLGVRLVVPQTGDRLAL